MTIATRRRKAAAAIEMALLMPPVVLLFVFALDYCRIFYYSSTLAGCARNGAIYEADPVAKAESPYADAEAAALADWPSSITPAPTVMTTTSTIGGVNYVDVSVSWSFSSILNPGGLAEITVMTRTVRVRVASPTPTYF